jgi:PAS domain S-box-containing protein
VVEVIGSCVDITERKKVEESLRLSECKYRLITENMQDLIGVLERDGTFRYASPSHEMVLGFPAKVFEGNTIFEFIHSDDIPYIQKQFTQMVSSKTPSQVEFRQHHAQGHWVNVEAQGTPVLGQNGEVEHVVVVARDISERKKAEKLLRKSEKLSVVGKLAAGVAHEIRNPLTSIQGFIRLLQKGEVNPFYFDVILSEIHRLEDIVEAFLTLAKPQTPKMKEIDLKIFYNKW